MTGVSTLGQTLDQIGRIQVAQEQLDRLQVQVATGRKATVFKDLGIDSLDLQSARSTRKKLEGYLSNIRVADRRIQFMDRALEEIKDQAATVVDFASLQGQGGDLDLDSIDRLVGNVIEIVEDLLNSQDGDRYLFAGADTAAQPYEGTTTMDSVLQTQINEWVNGNITNDELIDQYRDPTNMNDNIVGYSAGLSSGNVKDVSVRVDDRIELNYTVRANDTKLRNMLAGLSAIKNIASQLQKVALNDDDPITTVTAPGADRDEQIENFSEVFQDAVALVKESSRQLTDTQFALNSVRVQMKEIKDQHTKDINLQDDIIGDIENIDLNEVALKFNVVQTRLDASYRVTAAIRSLSLVNFI